MAEVTKRVCDSCGAEDATTWQIGRKGKNPWGIDLCDTCSGVLVGWQKLAKAPGKPRRPYRKYEGKVRVAKD